MVLDPLTEIVIGMLMAVRISGSQFMMDVLGYRKWSQCQKKNNQAYREPAREKRVTHGVAIEYHRAPKPVKISE